jgi:hypothetical protein
MRLFSEAPLIGVIASPSFGVRLTSSSPESLLHIQHQYGLDGNSQTISISRFNHGQIFE